MSELPTTFGKYFLTEKIATGGMAEIYLAKLIGPGGFEKQLIIKQIHPRFSDKRQFVDLFVAEAKTLVSLSHGNIVPVYELGVVDDTYFIAMEYIDGPTLHRLNERVADAGERVEPAMAAFVCAEVLKGLDYAHRKGEGVIHRDLSPRNVMVSREGEVKLVDFGIAVALEDQREDSADGGQPVGSFPYMSPEQVRRETLTAQTDLFSVGVLMWEMLTGESLFLRDTAEETLEAVEVGPITPPSSSRPQVPEALDAICLRALARDRTARYETAADFLAAVNRYLYSGEHSVSPVDVSRLVARMCPPEVRRAGSEPGEPTAVDAVEATPRVDRTVPMERAGGKRRAQTVRTFATQAQFNEVLAKATPLFPIKAIDDAELDAIAEQARATSGHIDTNTEADEDADTGGEPDRAPANVATPAPSPPSRRGLGIASALVIVAVIGVGAVLATRGGGGGGGTPSATIDAAAIAVAPPDARRPIDAAATPDATRVPDAGVPDARVKVVRRQADAALRAPAAKGVLKVGANPWGEVYLDGKKLGRAPNKWDVPAGKHTVRVTFPVEGRERSKSFPGVIIREGETTNLGVVDFSE